MRDVELYNRVSVDCDLHEAGIEAAIKQLSGRGVGDKARFLIVHPQDAVTAGRLAERFNLPVVVCPALQDGSWQLVGEHHSVYSSVL